ncbi:DUF4145 domain-containing protein [Nocardia fusca]|uniref:DUF4145 domain-containing protein n=1 Tax=Nocardia fusca TaxID=941183 RepID=UPI0037C8AE1E
MAFVSIQPADDESSSGESSDYEPNPDTLPTSSDPSGLCPRCNRISNFTADSTTDLQKPGGGRRQQQVVVLRCHGCSRCSIVVEEWRSRSEWSADWVPLHWWPTQGVAVDLSDAPAGVAGAYEEGVRCVSVEAPHAAVAMFRNALAQIVQDKGSEAARRATPLAAAIAQMTSDGDLYGMFADWATQIRTWGNAGAHQEDYEPVGLEDAQQLQNLTLAMIKYLYLEPVNLMRMRQATKTKRK